MISDIFNILNPLSYCEGTVDLFFPHPKEDIVLTKDEKKLIVDQINDVKHHLANTRLHIDDEDFDSAIDELEIAIDVSTCNKCKKKMLITAYDINHAQGVCELDEGRCTYLKNEIESTIKDFVDNYLPRVEEVLSARES